MFNPSREKESVNVLSLFDGMSCGQIALKDLGIKVDKYYASEVDKFAIKQTQDNFPGTIQLGDVRGLDVSKLDNIDLLIGGSPCTNLSMAGKREGLSTIEHEDVTTLERYLELKSDGMEFKGQSFLFWEYVRILNDLKKSNPDIRFLLENVEMGKKYESLFNDIMGCEGIHINSALVSAQNRRRIYWTNIKGVERPEDRGLFIRDIVDEEVDPKLFLKKETIEKIFIHNERHTGSGFRVNFTTESDKANPVTTKVRSQCDTICIVAQRGRYTNGDGKSRQVFELNLTGKSNCLTTVDKDNLVYNGIMLRRLSTNECAKLQTIPEWYKWNCSDTQKRKMLGNGWTIEVIKHIFKYLK